MIDITVEDNKVSVEYAEFDTFTNGPNLADMIKAVLDKAKYSGESISLFIVSREDRTKKRLIDEW